MISMLEKDLGHGLGFVCEVRLGTQFTNIKSNDNTDDL